MGGGNQCDEGLDGPVLYNMHRRGKIDRTPPGEGDCEGEQRGGLACLQAHRLKQAALKTEAPGTESDRRSSVISHRRERSNKISKMCVCVFMCG